MDRETNGVRIEIVWGDITSQGDVDAVVNAANAGLTSGGGVAGALHSAAGPGLYEEARLLAPISPGEAVVTGGHDLPNRHVIHVLGPVHGRDRPEAALLADCYRNALSLAEAYGLGSIAFPAISTGAFGYPLREATEVALGTVVSETPGLRNVYLVRFVLFSDEDREVYEDVLARLLKER